jgi:DNA-binding transcriptional LysR family regulator
MRELADVGWILNPEGCAVRAWLQRLLARAGLPLRVGVEAYNYELQMSLVARGRGVGLVPTRLLARSVTRTALCTLRVRGLEFPMSIWLITGLMAPALDLPVKTLGRSLTARFAGARRS